MCLCDWRDPPGEPDTSAWSVCSGGDSPSPGGVPGGPAPHPAKALKESLLHQASGAPQPESKWKGDEARGGIPGSGTLWQGHSSRWGGGRGPRMMRTPSLPRPPLPARPVLAQTQTSGSPSHPWRAGVSCTNHGPHPGCKGPHICPKSTLSREVPLDCPSRALGQPELQQAPEVGVRG